MIVLIVLEVGRRPYTYDNIVRNILRLNYIYCISLNSHIRYLRTFRTIEFPFDVEYFSFDTRSTLKCTLKGTLKMLCQKKHLFFIV